MILRAKRVGLDFSGAESNKNDQYTGFPFLSLIRLMNERSKLNYFENEKVAANNHILYCLIPF